jgi:hypothetical protein
MRRVLLTLPTPQGGGCSGDACGAPLRSRLRGLPSPTARFLVRRAGASSRRTESFFSPTGEQLERRDRALPLPQGRGLRADGKRSDRMLPSGRPRPDQCIAPRAPPQLSVQRRPIGAREAIITSTAAPPLAATMHLCARRAAAVTCRIRRKRRGVLAPVRDSPYYWFRRNDASSSTSRQWQATAILPSSLPRACVRREVGG